jgi:predicted transcriptional regulator
MKNKTLMISVGRDMDKDIEEIFKGTKKGLSQPEFIFYLDSYDELHRFLTPKKLDLLLYLMGEKKHGKKTVGEIAKALQRKQEAISRDIHKLSFLQMVNLKKIKQKVYVDTPYTAITIQTV